MTWRARSSPPGFIDCHTHSDWSILANRACDSTVRLGVTTEILGNCGFSHAPLTPHNRESISTDLARSSPGTTVTWSTFGEYLDTLAKPAAWAETSPCSSVTGPSAAP